MEMSLQMHKPLENVLKVKVNGNWLSRKNGKLLGSTAEEYK